MKNNQIANAVKSQMIDYFTNTIDSDTLIDRAIAPISDVSGIKRGQITELLEDAHGEFTDWLNDGGEEPTIAEIRRLEAQIDEKYSIKIQNLFI